MKKSVLTFLIPILLSVTLFASCTTGNGSGNGQGDKTTDTELKVSDYFPFIENIHMAYKGNGNEYAQYETYVEYIKDNIMQIRNVNPGTSSAVVYELKDGELRRILNRGEVYYRYDYTTSRGEEEILIKEPIKEGTSWTLKDGTKRSITSLGKAISTPSGNYSALEVTSERPSSTVIDYYVKNIGLVKRVFKSKENDTTISSELEKIEKNVPYVERIRIYFPDFNKDKLAYINREIEFLTNQDVKEVLEKAMKNIPEGSGLSKVLSDNTKILNIELDDNNDIVTVDFSSQFVTEMNAGTTLESMILKSVTNTFGEYFQKQKVKITLEGKPYSSGHVLMEPEDYFTVDTENTYEYK
ncbi:MAG: GerMN domain-containing protein [Firmicutes bacterium]|nr:GerMN domain-containing protein [Bacillota bacterium]